MPCQDLIQNIDYGAGKQEDSMTKRDELARTRATAGYTQEQLAEQLGADRSTVARWELGTTQPQPWVRTRLAALLAVSLSDVERQLNSRGAWQETVLNEVEEPSMSAGPLSHQPGRTQVGRALSSEEFETRLVRTTRNRQVTRAETPALVLVSGYAGSGKSDFGRFLSDATGWAVVDKDTLTRPLSEQLLMKLGTDPNDRHSDAYTQHVRPLEHQCLLKTARANLSNGVSTVLTAPFLTEVTDDAWLRRLGLWCHRHGMDIATVWVHADLDAMHTYLQQRDAARDAWKLNNWDRYAATVDLQLRPQCGHTLVDNSTSGVTALTEKAHRFAWQLGRT